MIRLCVIHNDRLYTTDMADSAQQAVNTPLSAWEPAQVTGGELHLPKGWVTSDEAAVGSVSLRAELNTRLRCGEQRAVLMVRLLPEGSLPDMHVQTKARFTVGRSRSNDLCCRDSFLSSAHGVFSFTEDGELFYEDASTNGTYLNGKKLHGARQVLKPGDQLDFPPLLQVVVDGAVLRVRYPLAHGHVMLPIQPPVAEQELHAAVYLPTAGQLFHVRLHDAQHTAAEVIAAVRQQLPSETAVLLPSAPLLRIAGNAALLTTKQTVVLREGMVFVLG